jgi:pimeloyl-ACP methyl ester carboxylesterase
MTHLDMQLEQPLYASLMARLASFCRLIRFDKRGTGLSDRLSAIPTLEERMDDVRAVMDAVGSPRAALLGYSEGGPMSIVFAATYPQRTSALILYGSFARHAWAPDNPWVMTDEQLGAALKSREETWGQGNLIDRFMPGWRRRAAQTFWADGTSKRKPGSCPGPHAHEPQHRCSTRACDNRGADAGTASHQ